MLRSTLSGARFQKVTAVMMKKFVWIGLTMSLVGFAAASIARADEWDKKTVLTFSQPVEIPGQVLPAGTYMFRLADSTGDRHIVQILNADGSQMIATVMAIPDYRLTSTDQTVIKFNEVPAGAPEAIRAWFYPGNRIGQEFVYPKSRAAQLAKASHAVVPAIAADVTSPDALKTAPIVAVTPEQQETDVNAAIQTTPVAATQEPTTRVPTAPVPSRASAMTGTTGVEQTGASGLASDRRLPKTASALPLIVFLGFGSIAAAFGLMVFVKRTTSTV